MVVCKYFQQGNCRFGDWCRFEHPNNAGYSNQGNYNSNNAYRWYGGNYRGGDRGSNRGVSFSTNNRFEALSQQEGKQGRSKVNSGLLSLSPQDMLNTMTADMEVWEQSHTWVFSCYTYFKDGSCIPGLEDISPEELRVEAYEAEKAGNGQIYVQRTKDLANKYRQLRSELAQPSMQTKQKLIQLLEEDRKRTERGAPASTSVVSGLFTGSSIGQGSSSGFDQSSQSVFGSSQQQPTGLFGKPAPPSNTLFGNSQSGGGSIFGNSQSSGSVFGNSQASGNIFGNSQSGGGSSFGNTQSAGGSIFGSTQSGGGSIFGNNQSGGSSVFGNSQSGSSLFGTSQAGGNLFGSTQQTSGSEGVSNSPLGLFGKPALGSAPTVQGGVFGNSGVSTPTPGASAFRQTGFGGAGASGGMASQTPSGTSSAPAAQKSSMYTPIGELTPEERQQFEAAQFTPGRLPTRPPPKELC